ncbi:MoaC2 protein [Sporosarcina newyorkensis 2681]|uniref:MoaC2 protein n=1 Tax=Sporosarcina newyorkensis 2681 TaxID=1027292 RepID=F9DSQ8_9BACL|nr:MoaC2 protein [Sporosarcina newyorkensis 2681]
MKGQDRMAEMDIKSKEPALRIEGSRFFRYEGGRIGEWHR